MAVDYIRHLGVIDKNKFLLAESMMYAAEVDEAVDVETCKRINRALDLLPEQCRRVIWMNVVEGKKYTEISGELGITINTIRTHVYEDISVCVIC